MLCHKGHKEVGVDMASGGIRIPHTAISLYIKSGRWCWYFDLANGSPLSSTRVGMCSQW
jgi:hypothetical protein